MTLADEAAPLTKRSGSVCGISKLDTALRAELDDAMAAGVDATALSRALRGRKVFIGSSSISRHYRQGCLCRS